MLGEEGGAHKLSTTKRKFELTQFVIYVPTVSLDSEHYNNGHHHICEAFHRVLSAGQ